jgi:beta-fructofuranosidase
MSGIFYKPDGAWAADFIPFYKEGRFRLFYLHDWRNIPESGEGTPWYQVSTVDLVHFEEHGEMLSRGTIDEQDLYVFTGSVVEGLGQYHIFYTGHNPHFRKNGKPEQGVMHAVSDDLIHWQKVPDDTHFSPQDHYEMHDWRDPFVFWNQDAGEFWMLLAARLKTGPSRRRGCTALCVSRDLKHWEVKDPLYAPALYYTHECPDLFRIGEWWYLVFSEFSERLVTRYRMAHNLSGPWLTPPDDQFDGRAFYAAKTTSDGSRRYLFGWNPTREGSKDNGSWHWGGNLVVHEVNQRPDGTLSVRVPDAVDHAFGAQKPASLQQGLGTCTATPNGIRLDGTSTAFACAVGASMQERCSIGVEIVLSKAARSAGIMLRVSDDLEKAYYIRIEPLRNRLVFDMWPRPGDVPFMPELERPLAVHPDAPIKLRVYVEGTVCEVYVNDDIAMSTRLYDLPQGKWGVFVENGTAEFRNVTLGD